MDILKNKNFLLIVIVRLIINFGDSLFYIVSIWYTSETLGSPYYTSLVVFAFLLPETLMIFIGPLIDKINPKRILYTSVVIQCILISTLIVFFNKINISVLLVFILLSAFMSTITYPIEEVMIPQIVETNQLVTANSILTITYKIFDALFNGTSGFLLATFSTAILLKINLVIFLVPIVLVGLIKFIYKKNNDQYGFNEYFEDLKEGIGFIKKSTIIYILIPLIFVNFFNSANEVVLPFFCQQYKVPSEAYGVILAIKGIGAMLGAFFINYVKDSIPVGKLLSLLLLLNGILWISFIFSGGKYISYIFILLTYVFFGMYNVIYYSLFQAITPIELLGRVTTGIETIITIAMPFGSIF